MSVLTAPLCETSEDLKENNPPSNSMAHKQWRKFVATNNPTSTQMLARNIVLGKPAKNGFTPITNATKLANGMDPFLGFQQAYFLCLLQQESWDWAIAPTTSPDRKKALVEGYRTELKKAKS